MRRSEIKQLPRTFYEWSEADKKRLREFYRRNGGGEWTDFGLQGQIDLCWLPWHKRFLLFLAAAAFAIIVWVGGAIAVLGAIWWFFTRLGL